MNIPSQSELGSRATAQLPARLRAATHADLEETFRIYLAANEDLNRRLGRKVDVESHTLPARAMAVRRNALRYDQERFWMAEVDGVIGGFGLAIERRSFWYLAALHILPKFQGRGLGGMLLRHCMGSPEISGTHRKLLTISEAANLVSTGLYARFGMFPQSVIVQLEGEAKSLGKAGVTLRKVDPTYDKHYFNRFDQAVLGETRPEDHVCWSGVPSLAPYFVYERDQLAGYIYVDSEGALGPAAVERPELLAPTISAALETPEANRSTVMRVRIPSVARESLAAMLAAGFTFDSGINLFLSSSAFGRFDQYLLSGADALF